jgi:hypothetical protein
MNAPKVGEFPTPKEPVSRDIDEFEPVTIVIYVDDIIIY